MLRAIAQLSTEIAGETDPISVLDVLQRTAAAKAGVQVLGAWRTPSQRCNWAAYRSNHNVFFHPDVPNELWLEYQALVRKHGVSVTAQRAWRNEGPFTFTEVLRTERPSGEDRWIFDLYRRYGRRDGFYCPWGRWLMMFTARTVLSPIAETRALLFAAANMTICRLEEVIDHRGLDRGGGGPSLSARELAVLVHLSRGDSLAESAQALAIQAGTAKKLLARAQGKLGTRHYVHAVAEALRLNLIS